VVGFVDVVHEPALEAASPASDPGSDDAVKVDTDIRRSAVASHDEGHGRTSEPVKDGGEGGHVTPKSRAVVNDFGYCPAQEGHRG
jgi:hypothetical protein